MNICIVGTGYVGLVTGACLAEFGNIVTCVDKDEAKINLLNDGGIPIFEPGLDDLVQRNTRGGRLHFTTDLSKAIRAICAKYCSPSLFVSSMVSSCGSFTAIV